MKTKLIISIMFIYGALVFAQEEPYSFLLKNKERIINNIETYFEECKKKEGPQVCDRVNWSFDTRYSLKKMEKGASEKLKKRVCIQYGYYWPISQINGNTMVITDTLTFNYYLSLLRSKDSKLAFLGYDDLVKHSSIPELRRRHEDIKEAIKSGSGLDSAAMQNILLLSAPIESKEELDINFFDVRYEKVPDKYKAHFDTAAENRLINEYVTARKDHHAGAKTGKKLVMCGTDRCVKELIKYFNTEPLFREGKVFQSEEICTLSTMRTDRVERLRRLHPHNPLLNDSLFILEKFRENSYDRERVKRFFREFLEWAKREYGVEPIDEEPPPVMAQDNHSPI